MFDRDNTRKVNGSYTVADTNWNRYTINFPADTTGKFDDDNASSLEIFFNLVAGSDTNTGTLYTTWQASADAGSATGQVNFADSTSNDWEITGIQLEVGTQASPFEHEPIATTVAKCERYHQRFIANGVYPYFTTGRNHSSTVSIFTMHYRTEMRSNPSMTVSDVSDIRIYDGYDRTMTGFHNKRKQYNYVWYKFYWIV